MKYDIGNVLYLMKPWLKYGKMYTIISILMFTSTGPISSLAAILLTQETINATARHETLGTVLGVISLYAGIILCANVFATAVHALYVENTEVRILNEINRELYTRLLQTDYKYFDNPEFYNNFTLTVANEYTQQSQMALNSFLSFVSAFTSIIVMVIMIMISSPGIIILALTFLVLQTTISLKTNNLHSERQEALMKPNRRKGYIHRIFYMRDNAADMKSTEAGKYLLKSFDTECGEQLRVIMRFAKKRLVGISWVMVFSG